MEIPIHLTGPLDPLGPLGPLDPLDPLILAEAMSNLQGLFALVPNELFLENIVVK